MLFGGNEETNNGMILYFTTLITPDEIMVNESLKLLTTGQLDTKYFLANICLDLAREIDR